MQAFHPNPPIFMGHFGKTSSIGQKYRVQELLFGNKYNLEGIHIVPNKIKPQEHAIEGKTQPDIYTRPFFFQMLVRNADTKQILSVLKLTVLGGDPWIPIVPPFNSFPIDYVAFDGDFTTLSVIIHGRLCKLVSETTMKENSTIPYPVIMDAIQELDDDCNVIENAEVASFINDLSVRSLDKMKISALLLKKNQAVAVTQLFEIINNKQLQSQTTTIYKPPHIKDIDKKFSISYSKSMLSLESVAQLIETIFSFDEASVGAVEKKNLDIETCCNNMQTFAKKLEYCWEVLFCRYIRLFLNFEILFI
jgi:hypothetical protein